eukprot:m.85678 g.85678  ORF g.85678 m.85678 type:complete len:676 (+) comp17896_c0_seq1:571-2598(+)
MRVEVVLHGLKIRVQPVRETERHQPQQPRLPEIGHHIPFFVCRGDGRKGGPDQVEERVRQVERQCLANQRNEEETDAANGMVRQPGGGGQPRVQPRHHGHVAQLGFQAHQLGVRVHHRVLRGIGVVPAHAVIACHQAKQRRGCASHRFFFLLPEPKAGRDTTAVAFLKMAGDKDSKGKAAGSADQADAKKESAKEDAPQDPDKITLADIDQQVGLLAKGVATQETRFSARVVRAYPRLRKRLNAAVLASALDTHMHAADGEYVRYLKGVLPQAPAPMTVDTAAGEAAEKKEDEKKDEKPLLPETELLLHTLVLMFLLDQKQYAKAVECAEQLIARVVETKRRTSDQLAARAYYFYARAHSLNGTAAEIRGTLHAALRTACLRCDDPGQATLINLLLFSYLEEDLVGQADLLVMKAKFPDNASNNELARYSYSLGRIRAVQLDYSEARRHLTNAMRKAPPSALGFLQTAHKLSVIVHMLLGEIPERDQFRQPELAHSLQPYFQLTQAVRVGDVAQFGLVIKQHIAKFQADKTYKLILRLRHNVIKTAVRMLSLSYSRISLKDVAAKLQLDSADDAQYIVAKVISDGGIEASIDFEGGFLQSRDIVDVYSTGEPQEQFHQRIAFCLKTHNDSVRAMRFPPNAYRKYLETPEQRREREQQESEIAEMVEKEDKEDFDE